VVWHFLFSSVSNNSLTLFCTVIRINCVFAKLVQVNRKARVLRVPYFFPDQFVFPFVDVGIQ